MVFSLGEVLNIGIGIAAVVHGVVLYRLYRLLSAGESVVTSWEMRERLVDRFEALLIGAFVMVITFIGWLLGVFSNVETLMNMARATGLVFTVLSLRIAVNLLRRSGMEGR